MTDFDYGGDVFGFDVPNVETEPDCRDFVIQHFVGKTGLEKLTPYQSNCYDNHEDCGTLV